MPELLKRPGKEEGITCVVRAKNEAEWIELSILSILEFADEIIFVDNASSDGTLEKVRALKEDYGIEKLRIYTFPAMDGVKIKFHHFHKYALSRAKKSWIFKWDADFVARTDQRYSIMELKELWEEFRHRTDVFRLSGPNIFGDHKHVFYQPPDVFEFCFERYLFRNRRWKVRMLDRYENLVLKAHRRELHIGPAAGPEDRRVYFFHMMGLKPDTRIAFRSTLSHWWEYCQKDTDTRMTYDDWLAEFWQTDDKQEQARLCMDLFFREGRIKPFEKIGGDWGDYPTIMKPYLENLRYEVVYENGKPARRIVHTDRQIPLPERKQ